jgi:hypothetical protein
MELKITIVYRDKTSEKFVLRDIEPSQSTGELSRKILSSRQRLTDGQDIVLCFAGKQLKDVTTLEECGIKEGSSVFAVVSNHLIDVHSDILEILQNDASHGIDSTGAARILSA